MSLIKSSNPTMTDRMFQKTIDSNNYDSYGATMTIQGSIQKFAFLLLMVVAGAAYVWQQYYTGQVTTVWALMIAGMIGGLICVFLIMFKPQWAGYVAPAYGILEGFLLGGLSAIVNNQFKTTYPNLVMQAVGLTFGVAFAMYFLYSFRIIRATERFKSVIITATLGIAIFYFVSMILGFFHVSVPFLQFGNSSMLGIGISLFIVAIAALNLILDFDMIERGAEMGAPKYMEWYGAFGLLVTIVWLYIEILRLLSRFGSRN
ncbi:MAG: Bax inhibitor-1/YccA family protein [Phycisphaerales bacterium]|nr:Bax inhibitor-1/YccA family protein [Phycisphaerales bacterium]